MATLTNQKLTTDGIEITTTVASATDTFENDGKTILQLNNTGASAYDVTIAAQKPCNMGFIHDLTISVPAGATITTDTFEKARFNDDNGEVTIDYGGNETDFEVAAIEI